MKKPGQSFLAYFGAFGTAWALLRDFGVETEAALIVVVFAAGVLVGLRLQVLLNRRHAQVRISITSYEAVRTDLDRFFVVPGHEIEAVDRVVERHSGYLVVVKHLPEAKEMARDADQRSG